MITPSAEDISEVQACELFDGEWYVSTYHDVSSLGLDAAEHYLRIGAQLLRDPGPQFSTSGYLAAFPDLLETGENPLLHFARSGFVDVAQFRPQSPSYRAPLRARLDFSIVGLGALTASELAQLRKEFDSEFYLSEYSHIRRDGRDPFRHYMTEGWRNGYNPSRMFDTVHYLKHSPDIAQAGINPFVHYVLHGRLEKRPALPFRRRLALKEYKPLISVIVPNYNHARFLRKRLESILSQSYRKFEVIVLDDCSTDDSRDVIREFCENYPDTISCILNERNSGNVFRQWRRGVEHAKGELVWICESDDFCDNGFLSEMVGQFSDRSVNIAFGRIQFVDQDGQMLEGLDEYRERAEPGIWGGEVVRPAKEWFSNGFGVNNLIANVGGCVWRRQELPAGVWQEAETYSILGDWFLYCHLAAGGQIAYVPGACSYFRQHGANTSVTSFRGSEYYKEHERLMTLLRRRWDVPDSTVKRFYEGVRHQYLHFGVQDTCGDLAQYVDLEKLLEVSRREPHVLIAFLGFHPGGGEVFPIHLANALRARGWLVSMLALDMADVNSEMLCSLDPGIPVYDAAYVEELGVQDFLVAAGVSLIHSHMVSLEWFFFEKFKLNLEVPYVVSLHGSYEASGVTADRLRSFATRVSCWVYTADKNIEYFRALGEEPSATRKLVNGMPVDPRPFPWSRKELGIEEEAVVFTLVARGIQRKGWRAMVEAFKRLRDERPGVAMHLLLCGSGEEALRHSDANRSDPDITFLGYQSRIHGLYRLSDCAVVPTRFAGESFPLCIIQALQCRTPVISTDVGEIRNMIAPAGARPGGIVIEPIRSTESFIGRLQSAMGVMLDRARRDAFGAAAHELSLRFDIGDVASQYAEVYEQLLSTRMQRAN